MQYNDQEVKFLLENYPKYGATYCAKILNRNPEAVGSKARKLKLKHESNFQHPSMCKNFNYEITKNPTKEFAYMLGFLWADGYILHKIDKKGSEHNRIVCEIVEKDFSQIFLHFNSFSKWSTFRRQRKSSWQPTVTGTINNKYLYNFLENLGFKEKELGFNKVKNFLTDALFDFFILGFFDGDGHISSKKTLIEFAGPFNQDWSVLKELLQKESVSFGEYLYTHPIKKHKGSTIKIQNKKGVEWFFNRFLLPNKDFGLLRKRS